MAVTVAEGVVRITADGTAVTSGLTNELQSAGGAGEAAGAGLGRKVFGGVIGAYAAIGVTQKVTGWIGDAIMAGSDYNETISKGTAIFGDQMGAIQKWASTAATSTGLSTQAAVDAATSFGDMFSQIGFTGDEAAKMSTKVVQAAADLGSFSNLDTADVSERISAAFRGEYDSLQAVIPNISAARVEQEAMSMSGVKNASALTAQQKAAAVLAIVQKDGNRAMGDFSRTSGGFANQMKIAAAQSEDLKSKIGLALQPALQAGAGVITGTLMPALLGLADRAVPVVSAGVATISNVLGNLGSIFGPVLSTISGAWAAVWSGLGPALQPLLGLIGTVGPQVAGLAASFSPLGIIIKALTPLLPTIGTAVGSLATALGSALASALVFLNPLITSLTETLSGVFAAVLPLVVQLISSLVGAFGTLVPVAAQVIGALMPIATTVLEQVIPAFTPLIGIALPAISTAIGLIVAAVGPLITALLGVLVPAINALLPVITTVFNAIVPIVQGALQIVTGVIQVVTGIITGNWSQVWTGIQNIFSGIWNTIVAVVTGAISIVQSVITAGITIISGIWTGIWNGIKAVASAVWQGIVAVITTEINIIQTIVSTVINAVRAVFLAGWTAMQAGAGAAIRGVVGFVQGMASGISGGINSAVSFFTSMPGRIVGALSGLAGQLASVGRNLMQGFIDGVSGFAGRMVSAVTAPIKDAIGGAKALLGIASPSRVFRQIGDFVGQGLVIGLEGSTGAVARAAGMMGNAVTGAFGGGGSINAVMPGMAVAGGGLAAAGVAMAGNGAASSGRVANYNVTVNEATDPLGSEGRIRKAFDMYGRM
jgi:phage-related protein